MDCTVNLYDRIIIGAGLYGLYAATYCAKRGDSVLLLEYDDMPFKRATYINQARVHMGYHYPRSLSTALKSAGYYRRFHEDFGFAIKGDFKQIYATSSLFSWTSGEQFKDFCEAAGIFCEEQQPSAYFKNGTIDGAFLTEEDTFDAFAIRDRYLDTIADLKGIVTEFSARTEKIYRNGDRYAIRYKAADGTLKEAEAPFVLNATYASCNQILNLVEKEKDDESFKPFEIKYELCEIILCKPSDELKGYGFTVMDGPFFSIMPFGLTGYHSLTSVSFTPHVTSHEGMPSFSCQEKEDCSFRQLNNCNACKSRPESAWNYMNNLAQKYLLPKYAYTYDRSLFSVKPILKSSEIDDSRPTVIRVSSKEPTFISVLSGKINTVYDLDDYLN